MSGQGIIAKRVPSSRPDSKPDDSHSSSRSGTTTRRLTKFKKKQRKMSSTHSLQVNLRTNRKDSENGSLNDTNRLDESEEVLIDNKRDNLASQLKLREKTEANSRASRHRSLSSNDDLKRAGSIRIGVH